jgi:hypothetical protein
VCGAQNLSVLKKDVGNSFRSGLGTGITIRVGRGNDLNSGMFDPAALSALWPC